MEECGSAFKSGVGGMEEDSGETEPEEDDRFGLCIYSNISDSFSKITVWVWLIPATSLSKSKMRLCRREKEVMTAKEVMNGRLTVEVV